MILYSECLNLFMIISCAIFALLPCLTLYDNRQHEVFYLPFLEKASIISDTSSPFLIISLAMVLIPAADLFLDCISRVFGGEKSRKRRIPKTDVKRLTDLERLMFIIGVALQSTAYFFPSTTPEYNLGLVCKCIDNSTQLLVLSPIVVFLGRSTMSFTPRKVFFIITTTVAGITLRSIGLFYPSNYGMYHLMMVIGSSIMVIGGAQYAYCLIACFTGYCRQKLGSPTDRRAFINWLLRKSNENGKLCSENVEFIADTDSELYSNYIPALHMMSVTVISVATSFLSFPINFSAGFARQQLNYVIIIAELGVLLIELRIRKNEIARGLVALLQTKKSYVRYISHELRTPLNTAFLGLKLLTSELKASKNTKDAERYDTLCDVNMSCTAAVSILNDLLCYEKLESGRMELHKEDVTIAPFLDNCMSLFSAQAQECDVTVRLESDPMTYELFHILYPEGRQKSLPLQPHDSFYVDKFKMDQVVRNLISNALKFTPRGGKVMLRATFVYSESPVKSQPCGVEPQRDESSLYLSLKSLGTRLAELGSYVSSGMYPKRGCRSISAISNHGVAVVGTHGKLVLMVTDTGAGISPENQKRLFKEIVQFSPEKLQSGGGSGLGLWITAGILDLHDSTIRVHSEGEGAGTTFAVEIPMVRYPAEALGHGNPSSHGCVLDDFPWRRPRSLRRPDESALQPSQVVPDESQNTEPVDTLHLTVPRESSPSKPENKTKTFNLLVVDDSKLNRKMLLKCLKADGHRCFEAEDGIQAVATMKERMAQNEDFGAEPFDAVLMDFVMPNMDGPSATRELRSLGYNGIIFGVTGNGLSSDVEHFLSCGADKVLLKPLNITDFWESMLEISASNNFSGHSYILRTSST